jgi:hypothetical protein
MPFAHVDGIDRCGRAYAGSRTSPSGPNDKLRTALMSAPQVEIRIADRLLSDRDLDTTVDQRHRHVLHEIKRLATTLRWDGRVLSDEDIDQLSLDEARDASIAIRSSYDADAITHLFRNELRASDSRWKDLAARSEGAPLRLAQVDLVVNGISPDRIASLATSPAESQAASYSLLHPEHFLMQPGKERTRVVETIGMDGGPLDAYLVPDQAAPHQAEPGYTAFTAARLVLASDGTDIQMPVYQQLAPRPDGVALKLSGWFPAATPPQVVRNHAVHIAVEFREALRLVAAS